MDTQTYNKLKAEIKSEILAEMDYKMVEYEVSIFNEIVNEINNMYEESGREAEEKKTINIKFLGTNVELKNKEKAFHTALILFIIELQELNNKNGHECLKRLTENYKFKLNRELSEQINNILIGYNDDEANVYNK